MSAVSFTPGTWRDAGHRLIMSGDITVCECFSGGPGIDVADANQRLIVAAPKLLAGLADAAGSLAACAQILSGRGHVKTAAAIDLLVAQTVALMVEATQPAPAECRKPGRRTAYASVDPDDNNHGPLDQWTEVKRTPLARCGPAEVQWPYASDRNPKGEDAQAAEGRSPESAVPSGTRPDVSAINAQLLEALTAALPRLAHKGSCLSRRPTSEWGEFGSVSFEGCNCEVKLVRAAITAATQGSTKA